MARKPMVTREIKRTEAEVFGVNTATKQTEVKKISLPRTYKDDNEFISAVNIPDFKAISVEHGTMCVATELRGMTEEKFIAESEVLPERKKKETAVDETAKAE